MNQRDELARELFIADNINQPREQSIIDWEWFESTKKNQGRVESYKAMAAGLITAGYSKPRTITTITELDALGFHAVVIDPCGDPAVCERSSPDFCEWELAGVGGLMDSATLLMSGSSCIALYDGDAA